MTIIDTSLSDKLNLDDDIEKLISEAKEIQEKKIRLASSEAFYGSHDKFYKRKSERLPEKSEERIVSPEEKQGLRLQALELYHELSEELDIYTEPSYQLPSTWMYCSVSELERGDALQIDGAIYIYLKKLAWWRNKTANILVALSHNPDKQKRIGELDFVYCYKGYVRAQQMDRMKGVII